MASDARIEAALPTLKKALGGGASVILMSHLGRPEEGRFDPVFSLLPVAHRLSELLGEPVPLLPDLHAAENSTARIGLLENVRFLSGEKKRRQSPLGPNGGARRHLRHGCLRHRPPGPGFDARCGEAGPCGLCRAAARAGTRCAGPCAGQPAAAADCHRRRIEGFHQAQRAGQARVTGGPHHCRRRHRQHIRCRGRP